MARKTSFYYSFLVLPPASGARSSRCGTSAAPWTTRWTIRARTRARAARRARDVARGGGALLRGDSRRDAAGPRLQPFVEPFDLPRAPFDALVDGVAMDVDTAPLRDVRRAEPVLPARGVGGRADLLRDLRLPRAARCATTRCDLGVALQLTNILRDVGVDSARPHLPAARGSRAIRLHARTTSRREVGTPDAACSRRRSSACSSIRPRARAIFFARAVRALPPTDAPTLRRRRDHARDLLRDCCSASRRADYDVFTRVHPRAEARSRRVSLASGAT